MAAADVCLAAAGQAGKLWKKYRKGLPPSSRSLLAEFLLDLRLHVLPDSFLDSVSNVGRARYDARGITELLSLLAQPEVTSSAKATSNVPQCLPPTPLPPPAPPLLPPHLPELDGAIHCSVLEELRSNLYGAEYSWEVHNDVCSNSGNTFTSSGLVHAATVTDPIIID